MATFYTTAVVEDYLERNIQPKGRKKSPKYRLITLFNALTLTFDSLPEVTGIRR
jgi:hypothetical protein